MKIPVLIPNIFDHPFTYESEINVNKGDYITVPFGKSKKVGVVWDNFERQSKKNFKLKKIIKKLEIVPLNSCTISFLNWFSEYNLIPKGMALKLHLLSGDAIEKYKDKDYEVYNTSFKKKYYQLTDDQEKVLDELQINNDRFRVHLLQGSTGSGKTIVYFKEIEKKITDGYQVLILLPEIGLTNDFEKKFRDFFGFNPAIWHSGISKKNKKIIWSGLAIGKIKVVIGARSALFLPFKKIGMIIVDEEHDQSFKQDEGIIYNARDMAISRASFENIPINLVTAVPSIETYENVKKNKYSFSRLIKRYKNVDHPIHEVIDLKKYKLGKKSWIASKTLEKVQYHLSKGDQVLFFLNRRGFSPFVFCKNCMNVYACKNCSINLVYHKYKQNLLCHYCGFRTHLKRSCIKKEECDFIFTGPGVERISEEVQKKFPSKKTIIFSSDTMNKKNSSQILEKIIRNEVQILIGTQLISKGFHFPNLNCIVVVDIDLSSSGYDLRGAEKNLQLYHQLSGRAGRTGRPATVYFQTYNLNTNMISDITNKSPDIFLDKELDLRKSNNLPPFQRFIALIITGTDEKILEKISNEFKNFIEKSLEDKVLGPVNAPIFRLKKKFRFRLLIRGRKSLKVQNSLEKIISKFKFPNGIKLTVDVDPINFN